MPTPGRRDPREGLDFVSRVTMSIRDCKQVLLKTLTFEIASVVQITEGVVSSGPSGPRGEHEGSTEARTRRILPGVESR